MDKEYYLCSEEVIDAFACAEKSKPFKSGNACDEQKNYFVAVLNFDDVESAYENLEGEGVDHDFWCRQCVPGQMDVSKITQKQCSEDGLFWVLSDELNLTTTKNQALAIYELAQKFNCTPIEFIDKIA